MSSRLYLVDDHRLFLSGVRAELAEEFEILGAAHDVDTAITGIREADPDVVLIDVHMPDGGGVAVIEAIVDTNPGVKFLALSVSDQAEDVIAMIRAGARGYVTKTIEPAELADAVRRVHGGDAVFSPRLAGFVLDAFAGGGPVDDDELDQLTAREKDVLRLIARGFEITFQTARSEAMSENIGQIRFFPDGSATGGRIGLALDGQRVEVVVDWLTGLVSVNHAASS